MSLVLLLGLLSMGLGEIVPAGGGLGWDGVRYGEMVKRLPQMVSLREISPYYAQRILPSFLVRLGLESVTAPLDDQNIIRGFQVLDLVELVLGCVLWKAIADLLRLGVWGRWFGFLSLFGNFQNSKLVFFSPVQTDTTAFLTGILMLWLFLARRRWGLFACCIVSAFVWPTSNIMGAMLLLFLRDRPVPELETRPRRVFLSKWKGLLFSILLAISGIALAWSMRDVWVHWRRLVGVSAFVPSLYLVGLGALYYLRMPRPVLEVKGRLASLRISQIGLACAAILVPQFVLHVLANPAIPNANSLRLLVALAYSGHRERSVRFIVNGSGRSEATLVVIC